VQEYAGIEPNWKRIQEETGTEHERPKKNRREPWNIDNSSRRVRNARKRIRKRAGTVREPSLLHKRKRKKEWF
jgi:hypothetical protein